jgi:hypothetical protein
MITYRKNSLKVKVMRADKCHNSRNYTTSLANQIKEFIEDGEYSRIVDWKIIGGAATSELTCCMIYEESNPQAK